MKIIFLINKLQVKFYLHIKNIQNFMLHKVHLKKFSKNHSNKLI